MAGTTDPSPELLAANGRLLALRQQRAMATAESSHQTSPFATRQGGRDNAIIELNESSINCFFVPTHLGWESPAITAVLRQQAAAPKAEVVQEQSEMPATAVPHVVGQQVAQVDVVQEAGVKLYPDLGLGMLRQEKTAPGRLWLLLRYLDRAGSGSLRIDLISDALTTTSQTTYLCGKRQLRNLLRAGDGLFWTREKGRIWLRSVARVAAGLGVKQLTGRPVALPVSALHASIGAFRAHLYAAFHSGRAKETSCGSSALPLSRQTLARLSGVGASSQRSYEARTGLDVQRNFAVGRTHSTTNVEECAWQQGRALFTLQDHRGQQGRPGQHYLAWQLPNSFGSIHPRWPKGRQKRINRKLKDLVTQGTPGNGGETSEAPPVRLPQRYYRLAKGAVQVANRQPERLGYWSQQGRWGGNGRFTLWQQVGGG